MTSRTNIASAGAPESLATGKSMDRFFAGPAPAVPIHNASTRPFRRRNKIYELRTGLLTAKSVMSKDPYFGFGSFSVKVVKVAWGGMLKLGLLSMYLKEDAYL
jgi:hypothetical protein